MWSVEYDHEVIHVIAYHMTDATHELHRLSDDLLQAPVARADHVTSLIGNRAPSMRSHPRHHRTIPKSRDFH